jgi:hypothetical protein
MLELAAIEAIHGICCHTTFYGDPLIPVWFRWAAFADCVVISHDCRRR